MIKICSIDIPYLVYDHTSFINVAFIKYFEEYKDKN